MRKRFVTPVVGGSSLLVIFAVLCLTVFALLSLSTVQADRRLSDASAQAVSAYYEADYQAEEIFAALRAGEVPRGVEIRGDVYSYTCPIADTGELRVELRAQEGKWEVISWQAVSTALWDGESTLNVWDGESLS